MYSQNGIGIVQDAIQYNTKLYLAPLAFSEPNTWLLEFNQMDSPDIQY